MEKAQGRRVLVCGGRDWRDAGFVRRTLTQMHEAEPFAELIHGAATGVDSMAGRWAADSGVVERPFPADWTTHGRAAGPIRNRQMLDAGQPDLVVAFPGGHGTANMRKQALDAGVPVVEVWP